MNRRIHVDDPVAEFGNSFGHIALWSMSFFLIAVARHSPLLKAFPVENAIQRFHIWPGRIVVLSAIFHGFVHLYRWKARVGVSLASMVIPSLACWTGIQEISSSEEVCLDEITGCSCYDRFRNLAGLCAAIGMALIGLTSLFNVRRRSYRTFYLFHAVVSPLAFLFLCLHFTRSLVYMAPSVLYYVSCSFPVFAEIITRWRKGVRVLSSQQISDERPCVSMTIEASDVAMDLYKPGQHVLLCEPTLSLISHPFTVNRVLGESHQLRIVFRETGIFTKSLSALLCDDSRSPLIHLDGFHGSSNRLDDALHHDVVIVVAGGIGIVAYLSLLDDLINAANSGDRQTIQVELHWICRNVGLIRYIQSEYLDRLRDRASELCVSFRITIYVTQDTQSPSWPSTQPQQNSERRHTEAASDGEPFSQSRFSVLHSRSFGHCRSILTYGMNICFGILVSWYACTNALKEEDEAATVWSWVCIFGIDIYVLLLAWKMDSRHFATFTCVVWSGLFFVWFFYLTKQDESSKILARLWSPLCIVLVATAVATAIACRPNNSGVTYYKSIFQSTEDGAIELHNVVSEEEGVEDCQVPTARREEWIAASSDDACSIEIMTDCGRPSIRSLLASAIEVGQIGVFACGPASLMEDVRIAVRSLQERMCCRRLNPIELYEESFEI